MDAAYRNAMLVRDQIDGRIKKLKQELEVLEHEADRVARFLSDWEEFANIQVAGSVDTDVSIAKNSGFATFSSADSDPDDLHSAAATSGCPKPVSARAQNPPKERVGDVVQEILQTEGKPISRETLFSMLPDHGIMLHGKDPQMVFSTMLWRMKERFVRLQGWGYWLTDKPFAPARYEPESVAENDDDEL